MQNSNGETKRSHLTLNHAPGVMLSVPRPARAAPIPDEKLSPTRRRNPPLSLPQKPDKEANWLPTPKDGGFKLALRLYVPKKQVAEGIWTPLGVERAD